MLCPLRHSPHAPILWGDVTIRDKYCHVQPGYDLAAILFEKIMTDRERLILKIDDVLNAFNAKLVVKIPISSTSKRTRFEICGKGRTAKDRTCNVTKDPFSSIKKGKKRFESRKAEKGQLNLKRDKPDMRLSILWGMPKEGSAEYRSKVIRRKVKKIYLETDPTKIKDWPFPKWEGFAIQWTW